MTGSVTDSTSIYDHFMSLDSVYLTRNPLIFPTSTNALKTMNFAEFDSEKLSWLYNENNSFAAVSIVFYSDLSTEMGKNHAMEAIEGFQSLTRSRLALIDSSLLGCKIFESLEKNNMKLVETFFADKFICEPFKSHSRTALPRLVRLFPGKTAVIVNGRVFTKINLDTWPF